MADVTTTRLLFDGLRRKILHMTNVSDGSGETLVTKFNLANTTVDQPPVVPNRFVVDMIDFAIQGFSSVQLFWDRTPDVTIAILPAGFATLDWNAIGGNADPALTAGTGNLLLSTIGASATATYEITMYLRPKAPQA